MSPLQQGPHSFVSRSLCFTKLCTQTTCALSLRDVPTVREGGRTTPVPVYVARVSVSFLLVHLPNTQQERARGTLSDSESPNAEPRPEVPGADGGHGKSHGTGPSN